MTEGRTTISEDTAFVTGWTFKEGDEIRDFDDFLSRPDRRWYPYDRFLEDLKAVCFGIFTDILDDAKAEGTIDEIQHLKLILKCQDFRRKEGE